MEAQLIVVFQNGYAEARDRKLRDRFEVIAVNKIEDIKTVIWQQLQRLGRNGHVLVRWHKKLFVCEMKQDEKNYIRMEVQYHPYIKHLTM